MVSNVEFTRTSSSSFSNTLICDSTWGTIRGYIGRRLGRAGIAQVQILPCDTCAEEDRFFSYRRACQRGESDYGRGLSAIYLEH